MPKLSICIPAYNYGNYLSEAIDSCLDQDADFSLIVLDNASSDNTPELRDQYIHDSRVEWYRNDNILPVQLNWNKAVSLTNGTWIKLLQADDRMVPGSIAKINRLIGLGPSISFIGHLSEVIDSSGKILRKHMPYSRLLREIYLSPGEGPPLMLRNIARLREPTSNLYTKDAWSKVGGYSDEFRFTFDISFNYSLMRGFGGLLVSEYLTQIRRHKSSDGAKLPPETAIDDLRGLIDKISSDLPYSDKVNGQSLVQYRIIELFLQRFSDNPKAAVKFLVRNCHEFSELDSLPACFGTLIRRSLTGDVQQLIK